MMETDVNEMMLPKTDITDLHIAIANVADIGWKNIPLLLWS